MNRNFVVTADIHVDLFQNLGLMDSEMLTPQARYIEKAMYDILNYMTVSNVETLFVIGDVYHRRNLRPDSVNNLVDRIFKSFSSAGITVHIISGNHDQSNQSGSCNGIERLASDKVHIYSELSIEKIMGLEFVMCPYMEHRLVIPALNKLREDYSQLPRIFMGHLGISEAKIGTIEKKIMEPVSLSELHPEDFIQLYFGHYHQPQKIGENSMYVGAPVQHNFGDSGSERGFWYVNVKKETNNWVTENKFISITSTPKFYQVSIEDFNITDYRDIDFVKVTGVSSVQRAELREEFPSLILEGEEVVTAEDGIVLSMGDSSEDWVKVWVAESEPNKRKRRSLTKLGNEILGKVGE